MPEQSNYEKLEDLLGRAPDKELPGLLEHASLIVRIRGMQPAKRKYERKKTEEKGAES